MSDQMIREEGDLRKYRTELPNMTDDDLDPFQYRLYGHYKRWCGANNGTCTESVRTTAERCKMSLEKVIETRTWLNDNGWIRAKQQANGTYHITILDRWSENFGRYGVRNMEQPKPTVRNSEHEPLEIPNTPVRNSEHKKEPSKNKPKKELLPASQGETATPPAPSPVHRSKPKSPTAYVNPDTGVSTNDIMEEYKKLLLEYEPGIAFVFGKEAQAAKRLAELSWKPEQVRQCYLAIRNDRWWDGKHLSLVKVGEQIGAKVGRVAYVAANGMGSIYNDEILP
jgi:hypothetical protein